MSAEKKKWYVGKLFRSIIMAAKKKKWYILRLSGSEGYSDMLVPMSSIEYSIIKDVFDRTSCIYTEQYSASFIIRSNSFDTKQDAKKYYISEGELTDGIIVSPPPYPYSENSPYQDDYIWDVEKKKYTAYEYCWNCYNYEDERDDGLHDDELYEEDA